MGDNGSGNNNFATTNVVSLCSLVSVAQKKEKENNKQIGTNKDKKKKKLQLGAFRETWKKGFNSILV